MIDIRLLSKDDLKAELQQHKATWGKAWARRLREGDPYFQTVDGEDDIYYIMRRQGHICRYQRVVEALRKLKETGTLQKSKICPVKAVKPKAKAQPKTVPEDLSKRLAQSAFQQLPRRKTKRNL
jgi:hypothetical protein